MTCSASRGTCSPPGEILKKRKRMYTLPFFTTTATQSENLSFSSGVGLLTSISSSFLFSTLRG